MIANLFAAYAGAVLVAAFAVAGLVWAVINLGDANRRLDQLLAEHHQVSQERDLLLATEDELTRQRNDACKAAAALARHQLNQPIFPFPDPAFLAGPADLPTADVAAFIAAAERHANQTGGDPR